MIVQFFPGPTLVPQVLLSVKSVLFAPVIVRLLIVSVNFAVLVKVVVCGGLFCPTVTVPKLRLVGTRVTKVPIPVRGTVCGLPGALSVTVTAPLTVLIFVGLDR